MRGTRGGGPKLAGAPRLARRRNVEVLGLRSLDAQIAGSISNERIVASLSGFFGLFALTLAMIGLYGLMAYAVASRTREIGIRLALGAQRSDIFRLVLNHGMKMALIGVALGLIAAFALTRLLSKLLYGVSATDPITFIAIAFLVTAVAVLAFVIPARRATKVDPLVALRYN